MYQCPNCLSIFSSPLTRNGYLECPSCHRLYSGVTKVDQFVPKPPIRVSEEDVLMVVAAVNLLTVPITVVTVLLWLSGWVSFHWVMAIAPAWVVLSIFVFSVAWVKDVGIEHAVMSVLIWTILLLVLATIPGTVLLIDSWLRGQMRWYWILLFPGIWVFLILCFSLLALVAFVAEAVESWRASAREKKETHRRWLEESQRQKELFEVMRRRTVTLIAMDTKALLALLTDETSTLSENELWLIHEIGAQRLEEGDPVAEELLSHVRAKLG